MADDDSCCRFLSGSAFCMISHCGCKSFLFSNYTIQWLTNGSCHVFTWDPQTDTVRNPTLSQYYLSNESAQWELMGIDMLVYNTHNKQNTFLKATVNWWLGKLPVEENCDIHSAACLDSNWRSVLNLETTALTSAFARTTCLAGIMSGSRGSSEDHKTRHTDQTR